MLRKATGLVMLCALLSAVALAQQPQQQPGGMAPPKTHLKVGDKAPEFMLKSTEGRDVKLSSFRNKKTVVLAFFPKAFTAG
jgi:peroxiredoxin Q/BCP